MNEPVEVIERAGGRSGELVLRRGPAGLEIVANGVFLVSGANAASSRALVSAAWPYLAGDRLRVLIGGLGIGDALDEALAQARVSEVVAAELEPVIVRWFREHGGELAGRALAAERAGRARLEVGDVTDVLAAGRGSWDLVALDTDNGPGWLVRDENAGLYSARGVRRARDAVRPGGAVVYWSPERDAAFEELLRSVFTRVELVSAHDDVGGYRHEYTMYVGIAGT